MNLFTKDQIVRAFRKPKYFGRSATQLACAYSPDGTGVFAGGMNTKLHRTDLRSGSSIAKNHHQGWVDGVMVDGKFLYSWDYAGNIVKCYSNNLNLVKKLPAHTKWIRDVSLNEKFLVSSSEDRVTKIWEKSSLRLLAEFQTVETNYIAAIHPKEQEFLSVDLFGNGQIRALPSGAVKRKVDLRAFYKFDPRFLVDAGGVRSYDFDASGKTIAVGSTVDVLNALAGQHSPGIGLVDWQSGKLKTILKLRKRRFYGIPFGIRFLNDQQLIAVCSGASGALAHFWNYKKNPNSEWFSLRLPNYPRAIDFIPAKKTICMALGGRTAHFVL